MNSLLWSTTQTGRRGWAALARPGTAATRPTGPPGRPAPETPPPGCAPLATRSGGNPPYLRTRESMCGAPTRQVGMGAHLWRPRTTITRTICAPRGRAPGHHPGSRAWVGMSDDPDLLLAPISADRTIRAKRRHRWVRSSGELNVGSPHYLRTGGTAPRRTPSGRAGPMA